MGRKGGGARLWGEFVLLLGVGGGGVDLGFRRWAVVGFGAAGGDEGGPFQKGSG